LNHQAGWTLQRLRHLASTSASGDRAARARQAAEAIRAAGGFHWVGLYDVTPTEITALGWTGTQAPAFPRFPVTRGLNGAAVEAREDVIVQDVTRDPRYLTTFGATRSEAIFVVAAPADGRIVGTIDVESDRPNAFTPEDAAFLRRCAEALATLWS
jgi:GAF domain-containing protein